ncbi:MAG: MarR family transcriptional regulator [Pseudomonadota bacterium]
MLSDQLADHLRHAAARIARMQGATLAPHGVTLAEWMILRALYDAGAVAPSALAQACGLTRGAVTKLVDRLRAKRLLVRAAAGREDRRYQTIALTGAGATLVPVLATGIAAAEARAFAHLSEGERRALRDLLATLSSPPADDADDDG